MKNLLFALLAITCMIACSPESDDLSSPRGQGIDFRAANKVKVCHNGHIINISRSALPAHIAHGDPYDNDGDGYYSAENDCGMPVDCNDDDNSLSDNCCLSGNWCGEQITYFSIEINFNEDCSAFVYFNGGDCEVGDPIWTFVSSNGNEYVYIETDPCGITGCTVTVTDNGDSLYIVYSNCAAQAEGEVIPCVE